MKKVVLMVSAAILNFCLAENCYSLDKTGNCGTGCTYTYNEDESTIVITASGNNATIKNGMFSGSNVDNIIIDGNFSSIGAHAFLCTSTYGCTNGVTISGKNGKLVLPANGWNAFGNGGNTIKGEIEVSPYVDKIDQGGFYGVTIDGALIIADNIKSIDAMAFYGLKLADGAKIYCALDNCAEKILDSCKETEHNKNISIETCKQILKPILEDEAKFEQASDGCSYLSEKGCRKCKSENFRLNDGECDRLRYTPAEAAAVLRDDDKNEIVITFKK